MFAFHAPPARFAVLALSAATLLACASGTTQGTSSGEVMPTGGTSRAASDVLARWPEKQRQTAGEMMAKYGQPDVMSDQMIAWFNKGTFVKTVIAREAVQHNFPMPHTDYLTQTIRHRVPADKVDDLFEYDGSVYMHRTRGELSAQCDLEPMNFLALNLAHDIAMGTRTVADARAFYARTAMAFKQGDKSSPYVNGLIFPQEPNAADPDHEHRM